MSLLVAVFVASLVGSVHCAGMCGGFVAFAAGDAPATRRPLVVPLVYSAGRLAAYVVLGVVAGALGRALDVAGALGGVHRAAAIVAGVLIVVWGSVSLLHALGVRTPRVARPALIVRALGRGVRALARRPPAERAITIGLLSASLPCGWLYAFVVTAAGTASAAAGAAVMLAFWLGTVPMMLSLGAGVQALAAPLRRHVPAVCAIAMIVVGLLALGGRVRAPASSHATDGGPHRDAPLDRSGDHGH